jgi:hypothetical protein
LTKFGSKTNYKPKLDFKKKESESFGAARIRANNGPAARPNYAQRAHAAHGRERPALQAICQNAPALSANRPALLLTIPRETSKATRTLQTPPVTTARSLATPALAGAVARAQAHRSEHPGTSPTPLGGRHSPTGQGAASGSGWTSRDAAGRLLPEDGQPATAATPFW